jgi:hypothetical protein
MRERLRERAQEWVYRFQYKGNFRLLLELMRTAGDGLLQPQEIQLSLFESLIDRIERGDINALKRPDVKVAVTRYFPKGLFHFHIWEREAIHGNFNSRRNRELRRSVFEPRIRIDFYGMLQPYLHDDVWDHLDTLLALTSTIFGNSDLPVQIMHSLHSRYSSKVADVRYDLAKAFNEDFRNIRNADIWPETAERLISEIRKLDQMLRILEGPSRLTGVIPSNLKAIDSELIGELQRYID